MIWFESGSDFFEWITVMGCFTAAFSLFAIFFDLTS